MTGTNELHDMQFQLALREAESRLVALRGGDAGVTLPESAALARLLKAGVKPDEAANRVHAGKAHRSDISRDFD
ncbi:hypothetical protein [Labrys monachus]|uniref:Uncharacterized protein n=1 Tax=Labrys monachus TaxID=217067 RepID=A0ABU0F749_9HYPH|nr:hypothetical protein [Labrys monachus]MDQ0390395.1 hypothetical protein [Labrys monachus]